MAGSFFDYLIWHVPQLLYERNHKPRNLCNENHFLGIFSLAYTGDGLGPEGLNICKSQF
jgi:hypothetical protein